MHMTCKTIGTKTQPRNLCLITPLPFHPSLPLSVDLLSLEKYSIESQE